MDPGSVSEDVGEAVTVTVTVTLSGSTTFDADKTVAVTVGARGDTAGSGVDYTAVNGFNITIPAGESSGEATFDLEPVDDGLDEPAETLTVAGTSAGLSVTKTTVTITDDDATPTVSVTDAAAVSEGDDPSKTTDMTFAVSLSGTSSRDVTVTYTLGGSAGSPADYTAPTPLSVTIAAGSTSGTITVPVKGDTVDEPDETVEVILTGVSNATLSNKKGVGTISDDDAAPTVATLSVSPNSVSEGVSQAATITVTATLSGSTTSSVAKIVAVSVGARGDSAVSGVDYTAVNGFNITIPAGESSGEATFDLEPTDDSTDESGESLTVSGTGGGLTVGSATVTITDDDTLPSVSIADASKVTEGDDPSTTKNMTFTVLLSEASSEAVTVTYSLGGDATPDTDYTAPNPLSVTIAAGSTSGTITVPVKGDIVDEPDETIEVTLTGATNAALSTAEGAVEATGTIADNDPTPVISISGSVAMEGEKARFVISMSNPSSQAVTVRWKTTEDTSQDASPATAGDDYMPINAPQAVTIPAGDTTASVEVQTLEDAIKEDSETFMVVLSSPSGGVVSGTQGTVEGSITDGPLALIGKDRPTVTLAADYAMIEGGVVVVAVMLSAPSDEPIEVPLKLPPDTAHTTAADEIYPHDTFYMPSMYTALSCIPDPECEWKPDRTRAPIIKVERGVVAVINTIHSMNRGGPANRKFTVELGDLPSSVQSAMPDAVEVTIVARALGGVSKRWWSVLAEGGRGMTVDVKDAQTQRHLHDARVRGSQAGVDQIERMHGEKVDAAVSMSYWKLSSSMRALVGASAGDLKDVGGQSAETWWGGLDCRLRRVAVGDGREADSSSPWCNEWNLLDQTAQDDVRCVYDALFTEDDLECGPVPTPPEGDGTDEIRLPRATLGVGLKVRLRAGSGSIPEDGGVTQITIKLDRVLKSGESVTVPLAVSGAQAGVHYTLSLPSGIGANAYVELITASPHSSQHPAVKLGAGARMAIVKLVALPNEDTEKRTVEVAYGKGERVPGHSGFGGDLALSGSPVQVDIVNDDDATDDAVDNNADNTEDTADNADNDDDASDGNDPDQDADHQNEVANPVVSVEDAASVTEGDDPTATVNMTFTVSLSRAGSEKVTIPYVLGGTAQAGADYTEPAPMSIQIAAGERTGTIIVAVKGDVVDESDETITVTLSDPVGAVLSAEESKTEAEGTITDDDDAPTGITLSTRPGAVSEDAGKPVTVTVTATVTGGTTYEEDRNITVTVGQADDSAESGMDYGVVKNLVLVIPAGADKAQAKFKLSPTDDDEDEPNETITVAGSSADLTVSSTEITIEDDDEPPPVSLPLLTVSDAIEEEGQLLLEFLITLSEASTQKVTVTLKTRDTSAEDPLDYLGYYYGETITFEPGETQLSFYVSIRDDERRESSETMELVVTKVVGAEISDGVGEGTILDDD